MKIVETADFNTFGKKLYDVIYNDTIVFHGTHTECLWFVNFT